MTLRTQFSAVVGLVATIGVGATGGILIYRSHRHSVASLVARQQLEVENYAHALRSNLGFLDSELARLEGMEEINLNDNDNAPEERLLHDAQRSSAFFNHTVVLLGRDGVCLWSEPARPEHESCNVGAEPWFQRVREGRGPVSWTSTEASGARVVGVVAPIVRDGQFSGALEGLFALGSDTVVTPVAAAAARSHADFALISEGAGVVTASEGVSLDRSSWRPGWREAYQAAIASDDAGTLRTSADGVDSLFAYAPVGLFGLRVVCRWRWKSLDTVVSRELGILLTILAVGGVLSLTAGLLFSRGVSRPLQKLAGLANRFAGGDFGAAAALPLLTRDDEIGALRRAFRHMASSLGERDARIRDDLDHIRRIAQEKDRLYHEVQDLAASLERRVEERTAELKQAQAELVAVERFAAMGKTAAALAHEVKNALNGIGMSVDLILVDAASTARVQRVRAQLQAEITRLSDLTESLLAFSRTPRIARAPEDLNAIVRRSLDAFAEPLRDAEVDVELALAEEGGPVVVSCDGHKIQGAVMNFVKNAIEAVAVKPVLELAAGGGAAREAVRGRVRVETRRQHGPAQGSADEVVIAVSDSGPGLSEETKAHLFEPFYTTKPSGTGLGLATAKRYVEAHGGRIEVSAGAPLPGASFRIVLPLAAAPLSTRGAAQ